MYNKEMNCGAVYIQKANNSIGEIFYKKLIQVLKEQLSGQPQKITEKCERREITRSCGHPGHDRWAGRGLCG